MLNPRILLIDDHAMFRTGLRMVLVSGLPGAQIVEAGSLTEALAEDQLEPDAVLLDIKLPGLNGVAGISMLRRKWPNVPVLVLSSLDAPEVIREVLAQGAAGFVSKAQTSQEILAALDDAVNGRIRGMSASLRDDASYAQLTPRQYEVLDFLCQGLPNKAIARKLDVTEHTVRSHVQAIFGHLGVASRTEAAFEARRRKLIR